MDAETDGLPHAGRPCSSIIEVSINTMEEYISNREHYFKKQPKLIFESDAK